MKYKIMLCVMLSAMVVVSWSGNTDSSLKLSPRLRWVQSQAMKSERAKVWVFFNGKDTSIPRADLTEKAVLRRAKNGHLQDYDDLPLSASYIEACERLGLQVHRRSRWLNAISGTMEISLLDAIASLPFVLRMDIVASLGSKKPVPVMASNKSIGGEDRGIYGPSFDQSDLLRIPELHDLGYFGQGVTIAILDNGFRLLAHEVFDSMNIVTTMDFVDNKIDVAPVNPSPAFGAHGISTLAVLGGYKASSLVGPAIKSDFILARTENDSSEKPVEEDNWIAAMEWAEGLGADIISSSVSYREMDPGSPRTYDWTWMNGDSTVVTKAANLGVKRGLIIVNSAGNSGFNTSHNTLGGPADGDSVIAAGAVDLTGMRAGFSSVGPTTRGRIKPDLMAPGVNVFTAGATNVAGYGIASGTSFSCPLISGVCAQILSANPGLSSAQVRYALRMTASRASSPDNQYGYGIIDALAAARYFGITGTPINALPSTRFRLFPNYPNPFNALTTIKYAQPADGRVVLTVYNILGQRVRRLVDRVQTAGIYTTSWDATTDRGDPVASGLYFYKLNGPGYSHTKKMLLIR